MKYDLSGNQHQNVKGHARLNKAIDPRVRSNRGKPSSCQPRAIKPNSVSSVPPSFAFGEGRTESCQLLEKSETELDSHHSANSEKKSRLKAPQNLKTNANRGPLSNCKPLIVSPNSTAETQQAFAFGVGSAEPNQILERSGKKFDTHHDAAPTESNLSREENRSRKEEDSNSVPIVLHDELDEQVGIVNLDYPETPEDDEGKRKHGLAKPPKKYNKKVKRGAKKRQRKSAKRKGWWYYLKRFLSGK